MMVHRDDLPAGHAGIFSVLHKKKTGAGKTLRKFVVWFLNVSGCKFNTPKVQSPKRKTY
jgi:hypothetical protein